MQHALELLTYRLQPGLSQTDFLTRVTACAPVIHGQPGLTKRHLACDDTGQWTEVALWTSQAAADAAGRVIMADPEVAPMMAAIDMASLTMRFLPILWQNPG